MMTKHTLPAGATPAAFHASFLAACGIGGIRIALAPPDSGAAAAAGSQPGAGDSEMKTLAAGLKAATDEVKRFAEKAEGEMKTLGKLTEETKSGADKALAEVNGKISAFDARLLEVEQKAARRGGAAQPAELKSLGDLVVDHEKVKCLLESKTGNAKVAIETKAITSATSSWGSTASVSNSLVPAERLVGVIGIPMRQMTIRDLLAPGQTSSNAVEFAVQTARTNNAAVVVEGAKKPESAYTWNLKNFPVRTIAHIVKASRQIMDDAPALRSTIDAEMRYGLELAEEAELLSGDGTGAHLLGLLPQATAYSAAFSVTGETAIDRLRLAALQGVLALYPMSGFVLNPTDWAKIEMVKDGMGRYIIGDPQGMATPRMWGLPVVPSLAMPAGTFLTGAFKAAAQIFDRMAIEVLISTENVDDFEKNMITIRAEERLALVVKRPDAFITGSLP